jgi:hypothetical protein
MRIHNGQKPPTELHQLFFHLETAEDDVRLLVEARADYDEIEPDIADPQSNFVILCLGIQNSFLEKSPIHIGL